MKHVAISLSLITGLIVTWVTDQRMMLPLNGILLSILPYLILIAMLWIERGFSEKQRVIVALGCLVVISGLMLASLGTYRSGDTDGQAGMLVGFAIMFNVLIILPVYIVMHKLVKFIS